MHSPVYKYAEPLQIDSCASTHLWQTELRWKCVLEGRKRHQHTFITGWENNASLQCRSAPKRVGLQNMMRAFLCEILSAVVSTTSLPSCRLAVRTTFWSWRGFGGIYGLLSANGSRYILTLGSFSWTIQTKTGKSLGNWRKLNSNKSKINKNNNNKKNKVNPTKTNSWNNVVECLR